MKQKKYLILTQRSSFFVTHFFHHIFTEKQCKVLYVKRSQSLTKTIREIFVNFGGLNTIKLVMYELAARMYYRSVELRLDSEVVQEKHLNSFLLNQMATRDYHQIISIGCPCKIEVRKEFGTMINLHGGLTQLQKGRFSPIKALLNNDRFVGVTIHEIEEEFDSGRIVSQCHLENNFTSNIRVYCAVLDASQALLQSYLSGVRMSLPDEVASLMEAR